MSVGPREKQLCLCLKVIKTQLEARFDPDSAQKKKVGRL